MASPAAWPKQQYAVVFQKGAPAKLLSSVPIPTPDADELLVQVVAVALNPSDWMQEDYSNSSGTIMGSDYAGIVAGLGKSTRGWKIGDQIAGFAPHLAGGPGASGHNGSFSEYIAVDPQLAVHIPESMSFEAASTLGMGVGTAAQALYQTLELPLPLSGTVPRSRDLLIYGGSTATGSLAVQFAKRSGVRVITTCSPRNAAYLKSFGADAAFDYNDPQCIEKIREFTSSSLTQVMDCIGTQETAEFCAACIGPNGGTIASLLPVPGVSRSDVTAKFRLVHTITGRDFYLRQDIWPADPEDKAFGARVWSVLQTLLDEGRIQVHPPRVEEGGLGGVFDGLQLLRQGKVSGEKLVYRVAETAM